MGDIRSDGFVFSYYNTKNGKTYEAWQSPESFHRSRINVAFQAAKTRAKKNGVPFAVTSTYLESIYPQDRLCPVLRIPLEWGGGHGGKANSPSLDRIIPELGYVENNLIWVSNKVNTVKNDVSPDMLIKIGMFYKHLH